MTLTLLDFAPVIMAAITVTGGFALLKLLVYLHRRQGAHPDMRRNR